MNDISDKILVYEYDEIVQLIILNEIIIKGDYKWLMMNFSPKLKM